MWVSVRVLKDAVGLNLNVCVCVCVCVCARARAFVCMEAGLFLALRLITHKSMIASVQRQHDATTATATAQVVRLAATGIAASVAAFSAVRSDFAVTRQVPSTYQNQESSGAVLAVLRLDKLAATPTLVT